LALVVKPAASIAEATVHAQIRDRLASMKEGRMGFLEKNAGDPRVASAVLSAPLCLTGLDAAELALVKQRVEQHLSPEIANARNITLKAMGEAEQGWQRAIKAIAERGGLAKGRDRSLVRALSSVRP
jgi:hypothetical protein